MALTMRECWLRKARILAGARLANRDRGGGIGAIFIYRLLDHRNSPMLVETLVHCVSVRGRTLRFNE